MDELGEVSDKVQRMMNIIAYLEWRKYRANVHKALTALIDSGVTFNMHTVLIASRVSACSPIDIYIEREIAHLAQQADIQFEVVGLWWNSYKGVA